MSRRSILQFLALPALLLACAPALAVTDCSSPQAGGIFDTLVNNYSGQTNSWLANAENYAKDIFWSLAAIEFAWSAITWVLKKNSMGEYLSSLFFKVMSIAFFYMLISQAGTWIPYVLQGFEQMAAGVTGNSSMPTVATGMISPSAVMSSGLCVIGVMTQPFQSSPAGVVDLIKEILPSLTVVICMAIMVICYFIIVLQLTLTEIEAFVVLFGGLVMLGFTGSRWTSPWGEKYFGYAVSVGVKLMVIFLVVSMGNSVVAQQVVAIFGQATDGIPTLAQDAQILMMVLVYAGLVWNLPSLAGTFLNGSPNMSLGTMAAPAMAAAGATAGAAILAAGALGKLTGGGDGGGGGGASANGKSGGATPANAPDQSRLETLGQKAFGGAPQGNPPGSSSGSKNGNGNGSGNNAKPDPGKGSAPATGTDRQASNAQPSGGNPGALGETGAEAQSGKPAGLRLLPDADPAPAPDAGEASAPNAFNDPYGRPDWTGNGAQGGDGDEDGGSDNNTPAGKSSTDKLNEFGLARLTSAAQHLKSSDGSTGSISIRLNHTD